MARLGTTARTALTGLIALMLGFVNSVLLARWLGPTGRGALAAAFVWPSLLQYIGSLGLVSATLYYAASRELPLARVQGTAFAISAVQGIAVSTVAFFLLPVLLAQQDRSTIMTAQLLLMIVPCAMVTSIGMSVLQGRERMAEFNALRLIIPAGYVVATIILYLTEALSVGTVAAAFIILSIITLVLTGVSLRIAGLLDRLNADLSTGRRLLSYGLKAGVGDIAQSANLRLDQALMAAFLPPEELGLYVVAVGAASLLLVASTAVRMVGTPQIAGLSTSADRLGRLISLFRGYLIVGSVGVILLLILVPLAIGIVYGQRFAVATLPAEILVLANFFLGMKDVLSGGAQALEDPWPVTVAELVALGISFSLLFLLLPPLGILGAALASLAAYASEAWVLVVSLHRRHGILYQQLLRVQRADFIAIWSAVSGK